MHHICRSCQLSPLSFSHTIFLQTSHFHFSLSSSLLSLLALMLLFFSFFTFFYVSLIRAQYLMHPLPVISTTLSEYVHWVGQSTPIICSMNTAQKAIRLPFDASNVLYIKLAESVCTHVQMQYEPQLYGHYNLIRPPTLAGILAVDSMTARWQHVGVVARNNGKWAEFPIQ